MKKKNSSQIVFAEKNYLKNSKYILL